MKSKVLLRDIPTGKFHSAISTTYSINFYYLEQQVLPLLASKGVHYVSLLVDGNMLSSQLGSYTTMSEARKRNYALHGVNCNGAFHPKIIFLAGDNSLLLLIGSGNLTSCGHGRNLESWNAVYVEDLKDPKLGLILEAWTYIKSLYDGLGIAAENAFRAIEANCELLDLTEKIEQSISYQNNEDGGTISFMASSNEVSLFDQLAERINGQEIAAIHIMSPYYDLKGQFIQQLQSAFKPKRLNVILQENFGMPPYQMKAVPGLKFFLWQDARVEKFRQSFFHAKHIIFEGTNSNLLFSGSANASIAAFGGHGFPGQNIEAGLLYESDADFTQLLGLQFSKSIDLNDIEIPESLPQADDTAGNIVYIKAVEKELDQLAIYIQSDSIIRGAELIVFSSGTTIALDEHIDISAGESKLVTEVQSNSLLYAEIHINGTRISNKQFIIDVTAFEATNPSPQNRSLNQIRKLIETGSFSSYKIIEYLNTIHRQQNNTPGVQSSSGESGLGKEKTYQENQELIYLSYAEIQERIREMEIAGTVKNQTGYKTVRLWDSIFAYLKTARTRKEEALIDEEETEDINNSTGRVAEYRESGRKRISKSNFNKLKEKVEKFLNDYSEVLQDNIRNAKAVKPTLVDLTMYLIVLEILLHLFSHREKVEDELEEAPILDLLFSDKYLSWSDFLNYVIGSFTLWCAQKDGLKIDGNAEYIAKITAYQEMALKTTVSAVSIFSMVNTQYNRDKIDRWTTLNLQNAYRCFSQPGQAYTEPQDFAFFIPEETREELGDVNLIDELHTNIKLMQAELDESKWYEHPEDGMTYIEKRVPDTPDVKFYKLIHTGYEWNESIRDYWNGELFSLIDWRWRKSLW
ncbi:hypothetical protein LJ707_01965 [Mucilaginibacter sp. UR6-1]|uniref:hypothetical protein n=1 Tax=Mucilaginibacter sp. UR6-1 TaxID=1435643 RepID=UPI001E2BA920|nr:hypothetical protein [Mucilaginibacter sp. UR6-1]MCC8407676.1 hypothetical protein [Mucilaginibacter sp. UR6-1]